MATPKGSGLRVTVDANVLFAGTGWPRFSYEVLQHALKGDFRLVLSSYIIDEAREAMADLLPDKPQALEQFLETCEYEDIPVPTKEEVEKHRTLLRDPADIAVALTAMNAHVDYLVTQDKDFTDRNETTEELHKHVNILLPGTFLRVHMGWTSDALEAIRKRNWQDLVPKVD